MNTDLLNLYYCILTVTEYDLKRKYLNKTDSCVNFFFYFHYKLLQE
jgi:hypothetical protein